MKFRAFALALSLVVLSGCALNRGPGSIVEEWREAGPLHRAFMVGAGLCVVAVVVILYRNKHGDDHDPTEGNGSCRIDECAPPPPDSDYCFLGKDEHGMPCSG